LSQSSIQKIKSSEEENRKLKKEIEAKNVLIVKYEKI
jgi:hypothetical protein